MHVIKFTFGVRMYLWCTQETCIHPFTITSFPQQVCSINYVTDYTNTHMYTWVHVHVYDCICICIQVYMHHSRMWWSNICLYSIVLLTSAIFLWCIYRIRHFTEHGKVYVDTIWGGEAYIQLSWPQFSRLYVCTRSQHASHIKEHKSFLVIFIHLDTATMKTPLNISC